ncbi:PepSY domain-containing protein [Ketogulonicigenium vulgare]|uniref:PepSY domain-containing protein n=1 Tax=Ketogulonicigenium vulgare TaxID=92945 RepID=UPI001390CD0B|nr:PepSY domain-containing protein [Ketogulonicigenium vulgare]
MKTLMKYAAVTALILGAGAAVAQTQTRPADGQWMSVAALAAKLEGEGYTLYEVERDDGVYEVKMIDAQGFRVEAHLDPATGDRLQGPRCPPATACKARVGTINPPQTPRVPSHAKRRQSPRH